MKLLWDFPKELQSKLIEISLREIDDRAHLAVTLMLRI